MANDDNPEKEIHNEKEGLQWEISKQNVTGTDYGTSDNNVHHNWQELSLHKTIRSLDEAVVFLDSDAKNKDIWSKLNYKDIVNSRNSDFMKDTFSFDESGNFEEPISSFGLVKSLSKFDSYVDKNTVNEFNSEMNSNKTKYSYESYLSEFTKSPDNYKDNKYLVGTYNSLDSVKLVESQYAKYGGITYETTDNGFKVYLPPETQAEFYNQTVAVQQAKNKARTIKNSDKRTQSDLYAAKAASKQRSAVQITVYKDTASKNDKIRKNKKKIEDAKAREEQRKKNLEAAEQEETKLAKSANETAADKYEEQMKKSGTPISLEEKAQYLKDLNDKSIAKISGKYKKIQQKATDRLGTLTARAESAIQVNSTADLFAEMEAEQSKKNKSFLDKLSGALNTVNGYIDSAKSLYGKAMNILNGNLDLSKFNNIDFLSKLGLSNNKFLNALLSNLGLKSGLFDNIINDIYKTGAAYAKDMLNSAIKLGMSSLLDNSGDTIDNILLYTIKPLVFSGGDPNYNGTFLKYILLADCPNCLKYLDEYNGISQYRLDSQGKEYTRGLIAANNGCHKVALYVAEKLYEQYIICNNGTETAKPELAEKYAAEIKLLFKTTVVKSYNSFDVDNLKNWLNKFENILKPCILGTSDIFDSGKYCIRSSDINTMAKIVNISEVSPSNATESVTFSASTGMTIDGKDSNEKFGKNNVSSTIKYIDVRNKNIKKIYVYLVGNSFVKSEKLTNKELHDRLSYPALSALTKIQNNLANNLTNSDTFKDLSYLANDVIKASVHKTLTLMASNNLIPFASYSSGNVNATDKTGSIPEFKDYSVSTITFVNTVDNSTITQTISNGKETKLDKNVFERPGYKFIGWSISSDSATVRYYDSEKIVTNSDMRLYTVWDVSDSESGADGETSTDNTIYNDITEEEISEKIENILGTVPTPNTLRQYNLTLDNFKCIDTYNKSLTEINREFEKHSNMDWVIDKQHSEYSDITNSYSITHDTKFISNKVSEYNEISNERDKNLIYYYSFCKTIVEKYARTLSYTSIESLFGTSNVIETYETDDDGQFIRDIYGNKIVKNRDNINSIDPVYKECLSIFKDACSKIREYCNKIYSRNNCIVKFDLCGLSSENIPSFTAQAFNSIGEFEPVEPEVEGFIFKGWSTDPTGSKLINWSTDTVYKNTILFAIWEKSECYIKNFILRKDKNDSLTEDVVGTIDHENEIIHLYIRENEVSSNKRYYVHLDLPYGCTSDINIKQKMFISETSPTEINVTDTFGNSKYYFVELTVISNEEARISYVVDGANIVIDDDTVFKQEQNTTLNKLPIANKNGFTFKGWSLDNETPISENIEIGNVSTVLYALFDEVEYNLTYLNSGEEAFDGKHDFPYTQTVKYSQAYKIDNPVKNGFVFDGYYKDKNCVTNKINAFYRYNFISDSNIYANWIDENEYAALYGTTIINGIDIVLSKIIFYTKMIMSNNERWVISGTGLNVFGSNGTKLKSLIGIIGGKNYVPEGITTIGSETNSTILAVVRHISKNKVFIYYSPDKGLTWKLGMECTRLNLLLSNSTGAETINYLTFYKSVAYNGHFYSVENINKNYSIIIDGDNNHVVLSAMNSKFSITKNRRILGLSVTVEGKLYVLFENVGVICYTNFEPSFDSNGEFISLNPNINGEGVSGWLDNYYNIDISNIGTPYTAIRMNMNFDDDFDINDPEILKNLNNYYEDKYKYIKTYLKIENDETPLSETIWLWSYGFADSGIILSEKAWIIENMNKFRPSILKNRDIIQLEVKPKQVNYIYNETVDPEEIRQISITTENCLNYLGWTRVIYDNDTDKNIVSTTKIDKQYLDDMEILDGTISSETWYVKYTRSELAVKEITTATGETFTAEIYDVPEMERSEIFKKYLKYGKI